MAMEPAVVRPRRGRRILVAAIGFIALLVVAFVGVVIFSDHGPRPASSANSRISVQQSVWKIQGGQPVVESTNFTNGDTVGLIVFFEDMTGSHRLVTGATRTAEGKEVKVLELAAFDVPADAKGKRYLVRQLHTAGLPKGEYSFLLKLEGTSVSSGFQIE